MTPLSCVTTVDIDKHQNFYCELVNTDPSRGVKYCDEHVLGLCVCVSVCLQAYLQSYVSILHQLFLRMLPMQWLSPLVVLQYVIYFRFYGRRYVCT